MTVIHVDPWTSTLPAYDGRRVVDLTDLLEALERLRGQSVLLVAGPGKAEKMARLAKNLTGQADVGVLVLSQFPTVRWIMGALLESLPAGELRHAVALVDYARHFILTRAFVSSVTRVESPNPRLRQHVRSWFPGSWYDIDVTEGKLRAQKPEAWQVDATPLQSLTGSAGWRERFAEVHWPPSGVILEGPTTDAQWQSRQWVEVSSLQYGADQIVRHVLLQQYSGACRECDRSTLDGRCAFCGSFVKDNRVPSETLTGVIPV